MSASGDDGKQKTLQTSFEGIKLLCGMSLGLCIYQRGWIAAHTQREVTAAHLFPNISLWDVRQTFIYAVNTTAGKYFLKLWGLSTSPTGLLLLAWSLWGLVINPFHAELQAISPANSYQILIIFKPISNIGFQEEHNFKQACHGWLGIEQTQLYYWSL